jgi:cobalt-zinc-cadmium efflux system protein
MGKISANEQKTFGYKRVEILAALFNGVLLLVITVFLFHEAWLRLFNYVPVKGVIMFVVATVGLIANVASVFLLRKDAHANINIKAAYLHLLGDAVSSVTVIVGSVLIIFFKIYWIDPVITFLVGLYILKETYSVLKEAVDILMQATPKSINLPEVKENLELINGVDNIHHVHIWKLSDHQIHFECHADIKQDLRLTETEPILLKMQSLLENKFGISHVTIQFEHDCCKGKQLINAHSKEHV